MEYYHNQRTFLVFRHGGCQWLDTEKCDGKISELRGHGFCTTTQIDGIWTIILRHCVAVSLSGSGI